MRQDADHPRDRPAPHVPLMLACSSAGGEHMNSPPEKETGPVAGTGNQQDAKSFAQYNGGSRQVSWWDVNQFVTPLLAEVGSWPMVGTPAWCALDDSDPVKLAAIFDATRHWALRVETCQVAECEASHEISDAADWGQIGRKIRDHNEFYAQKPWLKRRAVA
jgi:hypothetical protein